MKKAFMTFVALIVATTTFAQTSNDSFQFEKSRLYYGARVGLSASSVTDVGVKGGLTLGGVIGMRVSDKTPVFLETGLGFTQRGGKDGNKTLNLNYLELPILVKYGFPITNGLHIMPLFGPYFSYAVSGRFKDIIPNVEDPTKIDEIDKSAFKKGLYKHADMGLKLGAGAEWNNIYLEFAYKFGLANISDDKSNNAHGYAFTAEFGINF